ncbi:amino acid adenylation domain-containing protein [Streptomyces sp. N2-109]|uniref:Amino acid adenylation domain-containing protein n=1 Tax=Streptomyces gossypii TaxID=2883101 RepID=A0ABT2K345_9ACTN|nr:amino acid adenylation domain-containing protein [Streptomyces gossypii]MCT2594592.1 amino acid adenylation domain-containing protein [Streptomyces gossypii]
MNLHQCVIDVAAKDPHRLAVADPTGALTYGVLDERANALARHLRELGVGKGDRVVIWADKSPDVVMAMQAVLRLGAAYVPTDGASPAPRVADVVGDCGARALLSTPGLLPRISGRLPADVPALDLAEDLGTASAPINESADPDDLAYILYTSGSTGTPKGVSISHRNAWAFVDWVVTELAPTPSDRFANHAPLTFDLSVLDLYAAFAAGASVHLIPSELAYAPTQLVDFVHESQISIWYSVPSALSLMMRDGGLLERTPPHGLRAVLFAGEPFAIERVRQLAGWTSARLLNLYGPTETNVCTFHEVVPADLDRDRPLPIGGAVSGDQVWAQRPDGTAAGPGEEGELLVDGPTVMLGYWGQPPHHGPYATGDIVQVLPEGGFEYVDRRDHMVKVRGHRVELGEVEAVLAAHPDVAEAVVVVVGSGMDARLAAFVLPGKGRKPGVLALRRHTAERLPRYMLIEDLHFVADLPRTQNGKTDRAALAAAARHPDTADLL